MTRSYAMSVTDWLVRTAAPAWLDAAGLAAHAAALRALDEIVDARAVECAHVALDAAHAELRRRSVGDAMKSRQRRDALIAATMEGTAAGHRSTQAARDLVTVVDDRSVDCTLAMSRTAQSAALVATEAARLLAFEPALLAAQRHGDVTRAARRALAAVRAERDDLGYAEYRDGCGTYHAGLICRDGGSWAWVASCRSLPTIGEVHRSEADAVAAGARRRGALSAAQRRADGGT